MARLVDACRVAGIDRAVRLTDALIAATAVEHELVVITQDDDFDSTGAAHSRVARPPGLTATLTRESCSTAPWPSLLRGGLALPRGACSPQATAARLRNLSGDVDDGAREQDHPGELHAKQRQLLVAHRGKRPSKRPGRELRRQGVEDREHRHPLAVAEPARGRVDLEPLAIARVLDKLAPAYLRLPIMLVDRPQAASTGRVDGFERLQDWRRRAPRRLPRQAAELVLASASARTLRVAGDGSHRRDDKPEGGRNESPGSSSGYQSCAAPAGEILAATGVDRAPSGVRALALSS